LQSYYFNGDRVVAALGSWRACRATFLVNIVGADRVFPRCMTRYLFWNMPFHSEHHALPAVPFHALPAARLFLLDTLEKVGRLSDANTNCNSLGNMK